LQIRSFRAVFALERRLYKVDRWRLPFPYGVPLASLGYGLACLLAVLVAARLPVIGALVALVPPPVRLVLAPAALGMAAARLRVDARPAHRFAWAWARQRLARRRLRGFAALSASRARRMGDIVLAAHPAGGYRAARVRGPARVLLRYPARARDRGGRLDVYPLAGPPLDRARSVTIAAGAQLRVHGPARAAARLGLAGGRGR
jgi:hypothetical protein